MIGPPERKSPAGGRGSENRLVRGEFHKETYSEQAEIARPRCADCALFYAYDDPRYRNQGECRAEPPQRTEDTYPSWGWPRIGASNWCGAFMRRAGT
jgi:hypothetical protein